MAFVYVICVGITFGIILFWLKYQPISLKFKIREGNYKEVTLLRSHLLQTNATVIAGIFIFLTIQGTLVAGFPALIDTNVINVEIKKYDEIRKDESREQIVRDEAEKKYAESTLELEKKYIRLSSAYDYQNVQYFFNPIVIFSASLLPFTMSSMFVIASKGEQDFLFAISKAISIVGFFMILAAALMFVGFPIIPQG